MKKYKSLPLLLSLSLKYSEFTLLHTLLLSCQYSMGRFDSRKIILILEKRVSNEKNIPWALLVEKKKGDQRIFIRIKELNFYGKFFIKW